jgi:hypothetical protein
VFPAAVQARGSSTFPAFKFAKADSSVGVFHTHLLELFLLGSCLSPEIVHILLLVFLIWNVIATCFRLSNQLIRWHHRILFGFMKGRLLFISLGFLSPLTFSLLFTGLFKGLFDHLHLVIIYKIAVVNRVPM